MSETQDDDKYISDAHNGIEGAIRLADKFVVGMNAYLDDNNVSLEARNTIMNALLGTIMRQGARLELGVTAHQHLNKRNQAEFQVAFNALAYKDTIPPDSPEGKAWRAAMIECIGGGLILALCGGHYYEAAKILHNTARHMLAINVLITEHNGDYRKVILGIKNGSIPFKLPEEEEVPA